MKWKILSSSYLFSDTWLKARKDRCERPDGRIVDPYYVLEYPNWVTGLGITEDNKAVLIKQYRHALGQECIEVPGGCIDDTDPNHENAIRREFLEETGYAFETAKYLGITSPNPSTNANLMHMYLLTGGKKVQEQNLDANEDIEVLTISLDELAEMLRQNKFIQSMHVATIMYAMQELGKLKVSG